MSLFQPIDVRGPAQRGNLIQQLAQNASQNVMRRQRMKKLIQAGAAAAGGARAAGAGMPLRSSMAGHAVGVRGSIMRPPGFNAQQLAAMLAGAGDASNAPGGRTDQGGMYAPGGGGYDFGSLPDPNDPHQSPASLGDPATAPAAMAPAPMPGGMNSLPMPQQIDTAGVQAKIDAAQSGFTPDPAAGSDVMQQVGTSNNLIPLGNGMYYDPVNDALRGGGGGVKPPMGRVR